MMSFLIHYDHVYNIFYMNIDMRLMRPHLSAQIYGVKENRLIDQTSLRSYWLLDYE